MDDTDIETPRRQSWWRKLNDNSNQEVMELLEHEDVPDNNVIMEENFDLELVSQEKKNHTMDLPDSSDCESIKSIVMPQRKLFTYKESHPPKKFIHVMNNREQIATSNEIDVRPKSLFNQPTKTLPKPIFPSALCNMSTNKSIANKTELPVIESKEQAHSLFGNRPGTKRKNMFADFIASESEDEIPDIQPKVFGFKKKQDDKQRLSHADNELYHSSTTSIIDIDDWKYLPSSTMVENQIGALEASPSKRKRLSKFAETNKADASKNMKTFTVKEYVTELQQDAVNDEEKINTSIQTNQSRNKANSSMKSSTRNQANESNEISNNSDLQIDKIDFNGEVNKQTKQANESTISQEMQDEESSDKEEENDEREHEESSDEKDEHEEDEDIESGNEESEEISESEENENANETSNKDVSTREERVNKKLDHQNEIDVVNDIEQMENCESETNDNKNINMNSSRQTKSSTSENRKYNTSNEKQPEASLFQKSHSLIESFTLKKNNSAQMTKSMIRQPLRPSLAPERENTGFSDNTGNSTANSGWDSHRTTRKTLRKTFGKDFTPRKSLRTLVMEKAAHLQSNPKPESPKLVATDEKSEKRKSFYPDLCNISIHPNANSTELVAHEVKSAKRQSFNPDIGNISKLPNANSTEILREDERLAKHQTFNPDLRDISKHPHANSTELPVCDGNEPLEQSNVEKSQTVAKESDQNGGETTKQSHTSIQEIHAVVAESEKDDETAEKSQAESGEDDNEEMEDHDNIGDTQLSEAESVIENHEEMDEDDNNETMEESKADSGEDISDEIDDVDNNETAEESEHDLVEENREEIEADEDKENTEQSEVEIEDEESIEETDENVNETTRQSANETSDDEEINESDNDLNENTEQSEEEIMEAHHTKSNETVKDRDHKRTSQIYLQKIIQERLDIEKKVREDIEKKLKLCANRNSFKPLFMPPRVVSKPTKIKPKVARAPLCELPPEMEADLRYKPPKLYKPRNASWATKRLYKYFESKLEPKYSYKSRVRAEKLVHTLYEFCQRLRRRERASSEDVDTLKREFARLCIVTTHNDFYHFFHEYMPREVRIKVNPDIVNKIQPPPDVFANIL